MKFEFKKIKSYWPALLLGTVGVLLILFGGGHTATAAPEGAETSDAEAYRIGLEEQLEILCRGIAGAEKAQVAVTLEGGYRTVYVSDAKGSPVSVGGQALIQEVLNPTVAGVGILCPGADAALEDRLLELVSTVLCISSHRIFIVR